MRVTMTNAEAVHRLNNLCELEHLNNLVPAIVSYRIVQNIRALEAALAPCEEVRERTIRKYANGGTVINRDTDPEAFAACSRELSEIEQLTISVDVNTFPIDLIAEGRFPISAIFALDFMIENTTAKEV